MLSRLHPHCTSRALAFPWTRERAEAMKRPYAVALGTISGPIAETPPCAACGRRLKMTAASMRALRSRRLPLLCPYCGEDRRTTRPMTAAERRFMLESM